MHRISLSPLRRFLRPEPDALDPDDGAGGRPRMFPWKEKRHAKGEDRAEPPPSLKQMPTAAATLHRITWGVKMVRCGMHRTKCLSEARHRNV